MIPVTKPFLPPINEYKGYIDSIWKRNWLTNNGPLLKEFEVQLKNYLNIENLLYVSNGTIALQMAIKALDIKGEVITTPFSYVATTSTLVWENCTPIFVDIDENTFNIDPQKIEAAITEKTTAILATHVYGNPCNIDAIDKIAKKHSLKVIYDAAHCFGTKYKGKSVFAYGDISTTSFHATKVFQTIEGGAVFSSNKEVLEKLEHLRNFGHDGYENFNGIGINGKNSEFHAAMGLCNLSYIDEVLLKRNEDYNLYFDLLKCVNLTFLQENKDGVFNFSYFPIVFESEELLLNVVKKLNDKKVFPRRYFFPLLSELDYVHNDIELINAIRISKTILCLPHYYELERIEIENICSIINRVFNV